MKALNAIFGFFGFLRRRKPGEVAARLSDRSTAALIQPDRNGLVTAPCGCKIPVGQWWAHALEGHAQTKEPTRQVVTEKPQEKIYVKIKGS